MPLSYHRWHWRSSFGQSRYYLVSRLPGEWWSPYLGFVGIAGLAWLAGMSIFRLFLGMRLDSRSLGIGVMALVLHWIF